MTFLYFNGCSYTLGTELDDREGQRFSTLVSKHFKADHLNDSIGGASNDLITTRTLRFLENNRCDHAIIMLTHCERMHFNKKLIITQDPIFYENYYTDEVGALNFYKNRYILEQEFEKKNIPLILLQYHNVYGDNVWSRRCKGRLQTISKLGIGDREETLLGRRKNKKYYYSDTKKKMLCHFNIEGHKRVADYIIGRLTSTI
mgnify:CR=1 FL=1|tara:strand:- start:952 stop:1557 length:606 start_codon:yes stop_codon:yes gene_type:complete